MSTKEQVLQFFEQNRNKDVSGQQLAEKLHVSRTSIWKAVKSLQAEGFLIEATTNKGYKLSTENDLLSKAAVLPLLKEIPDYFEVYSSVDSTNNLAKEAINHETFATGLIISEEQTEGRGRLGRDFYSPKHNGIYLSLIYTNVSNPDPTFLTTAAAVSVCQGIEDWSDKEPVIKWVNDIYLDNKKIGGILTEGIMNFETGLIETVIIGIGLNVYLNQDGFPESISTIAGTLFEKKQTERTRNQLVASIINHFTLIYKKNDFSHLKEYRKRCFVLGKKISFEENKQTFYGKALEVDDKGGLKVKLTNGQLRTLRFGEISTTIYENEKMPSEE